MPRLRRSNCGGKGLARRRAGKGFLYVDENGNRITDEEAIGRIKDLAIPPAWEDVWICPQENGHIQATGFDDAGRKQYLYHEAWSRSRSATKFETMLDFAEHLPALRRTVSRDLDPDDPGERSVLALGIRLIDLGHFRVGGEQYAAENETYGAATLLKEHVSLGQGAGEVIFEYPAKGSQERTRSIQDRDVRGLTEILLRRRSGPDDFLVYKAGREWMDVTSTDLNRYIQENADERFSAKDFRTWNGTVLAALGLAARGEPPASARARERRIREAIQAVAAELGNTPAVARNSYVDPRVLDRYRNGEIIQGGRGTHRRSRNGLSKVESRVRVLVSNTGTT